MTWNSSHLLLLRGIGCCFWSQLASPMPVPLQSSGFWLCWSRIIWGFWLESLTCWGLATYWLSVIWFGIALVLLHVSPTSLCEAGPAFSWQRRQSNRESRNLTDIVSMPYSMLAVKARTRPVQMPRLKNRLYLLRWAALKSYHKEHGHKERSGAAAIFAIDRPNTGIYFFITIPCSFMKLSQ